MIDFDFIWLAKSATIVVFLLEFAKTGAKKAPAWVWRAALILVSILVAVVTDGGFWQVATNATGLVAVSFAGYKVIWKTGKGLLESLLRKIGAPDA